MGEIGADVIVGGQSEDVRVRVGSAKSQDGGSVLPGHPAHSEEGRNVHVT
jgi:hypothetical protein